MKQFAVTEILTNASGDTILLGKQGMLVIQRFDRGSNARFSRSHLFSDDETHRLKVSEIPTDRKSLLNSIAF